MARAFVLAFSLMQCSARICQAGVDSPLEIRFVGGLVAENFAAVVDKLGRSHLLENEVQSVTEPSPINQLFLNKRIPGGAVARALAIYLCDLNQHVCSQQTDGALVWTNQISKKEPITSRTPRKCVQQDRLLLQADELCLPKLDVTEYLTSLTVYFNGERDSLRRKVIDLGTCKKFDEDCIRDLVNFNPWLSREALRNNKVIGEIRFPVPAYKLNVDVSGTWQANEVRKGVEEVSKQQQAAGQFDRRNSNIYITVPGRPLAPLQAQSSTPAVSALAGYWEKEAKYLEVMNYPWAVSPEKQRAFLSRISPVPVGIWDRPVDRKHCFLNGRIAQYDEARAWYGAEAKEGQVCGTIKKFEDNDHGTFVSGVVGGVPEIFPSINPATKLWVYELNSSKLSEDNDPISPTWRNGLHVGVINISMNDSGYAYRTQLEKLILGYNRAEETPAQQFFALFVAAAGNKGSRYDSMANCDTVPACWSSDTMGKALISVIGLDETGKGLLKCPTPTGELELSTNYGEAFDVAAVGVGISSLYANTFGEMCGTSVAAPYVSGLASLLMGKALKLFEEKRQRSYPLPGDIKERILATADWDKNLEKKVRFGRVNFARALAYDVDLLETNSFNCGAEALRCLVAKAQKKLHVVSAIEASGTRSDFDQALSLVRRIVREESDSSTFRMIVDDLGALKVLRKVKFATNAALDIRRGSSKKSERIALRDVVDFVPCSGSEQCMSAR